MLNQYFQDIYKTYKTGDATEASYYPDLKNLLSSFLKSKGVDPNITIIPRKTKVGIPDFTIRKNKDLVGYVEAKDLIIEDLQTIEHTGQIKRYKEKLPNFILTNYFDFWLWRRDLINEKGGRWVKKVRIGQPVTLKLNTPPPLQHEKEFFELLEAFFSYYLPERKTAKSLAIELASRAQLLPSYIIEELNNNVETEIDRIYSAFKKFLISDLTKEDFADIYAQTISYGLFTARLRYQGKDFNRLLAQELIPKNIQILYDTFNLISHDQLTESLAWIIDDMTTVLAHADIEKIRKELHREKGGDDPLMHFYETFLAEYDPKKRKAKGVYYTPLPVVSYITRSINILLKEKFEKKYGFADDGVTLLDPASGTLAFPANAIAIAKEEVDKSPNAGSWLQIVKNHILKNYYAFELLMAPYIIGHLKASLILEDLGYKMKNDERFRLYLTNTLDLSDVEQSQMPFVAGLSEEAKRAKEVKEKIPILVVMGNPPYSVSSSNIIKEGSDFYKLYESYKEKVRKEEKNIQPLSDDYIKFIAFAHWKIKQAGQGIVGMITNNSYLDGIIHRDMRQKLLEDFNEIYILNLHGSSKRKEKTPEGGKDENVFDIQQGVGIILLIKTGKNQKPEIKYADVWGLREEKYKFLEEYDVKKTDWRNLEIRDPYFFFVPKDFKLEQTYNKFINVKDLFFSFSAGVVTSRDKLLIDNKKEDLKIKLSRFFDKNYPSDILRSEFELQDTGTWKLEPARKAILEKGIDKDLFFSYTYRPFDDRYIYYEKLLIERDRENIMSNLLKPNLAICLMKRVLDSKWKDVFVSQHITDYHYIGSQTYVFPLFIYSNTGDEQRSLKIINGGVQQGNFSDQLWESVPTGVEPERVFNYIYAVLYSNVYRKKYNEFLKIDFPKIPFTKDTKLFYKVAEIGKELVDLHLLKSERLENSGAEFPITGDNRVSKREYNEKKRQLHINDKQYFNRITPEIWNYYIGGYQVLDKWLKDRINKSLLREDIDHYLKVITAIKWTIYFQGEIDKIYLKIEKSIIKR